MDKRIIKFRGLSINGEWYYGLLSHSTGAKGTAPEGWYISNKAGMPWAYQVRPETVGQFTGLPDKNGTEIYDGDILLDQFEDKAEDEGEQIRKIYYPIVFKDGSFGWIGENTGEFHSFCEYPIPRTIVIGNIYENKNPLTP